MTCLAIQSAGAFTSVGLDILQTMGSLRTRVQRFEELGVDGPDGEPIVGAPTPIPLDRFQGQERLVAMGAMALSECGQGVTQAMPLFLCCPDPEEAKEDWEGLAAELAKSSGLLIDRARSRVFPSGRAAIADALRSADDLLRRRAATACYVGGVDSLVSDERLLAAVENGRVKHGDNSNGFVPGEAAAFVRVGPGPARDARALVCGIGTAKEAPLHSPDRPNTAVGLTRAMRSSLADASAGVGDVSLLAHDVSGERHRFQELSLAITRLRFRREQRLDTWDAATCVGEVGAAAGPLTLAYLGLLLGSGASPRAALQVACADQGGRAAIYLKSHETRSEK